jgi:hypothetical protein
LTATFLPDIQCRPSFTSPARERNKKRIAYYNEYPKINLDIAQYAAI